MVPQVPRDFGLGDTGIESRPGMRFRPDWQRLVAVLEPLPLNSGAVAAQTVVAAPCSGVFTMALTVPWSSMKPILRFRSSPWELSVRWELLSGERMSP